MLVEPLMKARNPESYIIYVSFCSPNVHCEKQVQQGHRQEQEKAMNTDEVDKKVTKTIFNLRSLNKSVFTSVYLNSKK